MVAPGFGVGADELLRRQEGIGRLPEYPLRLTELGLARTERMDAAGARIEAVEVPPAGAVGDEIEDAVGRELRLEDRFPGAAGNPPRARQRAVGGDLGQPQFGADPRHVGVVPGEPGEPRAIRRQSGRGVKIMALRQHTPRPRRARIDRDQRVVDPAVGAMLLAHADPAPPRRIEPPVGITKARAGSGFRGQRPRRPSGHLPIKALIGEIAEEDDAARYRRRAAAIFVHPGAHAEPRRRDVGDGAIRRAPDEDAAPLLARPSLDPVDVLAIDQDVAEADRLGDDQIRGDRRAPAAIEQSFSHR